MSEWINEIVKKHNSIQYHGDLVTIGKSANTFLADLRVKGTNKKYLKWNEKNYENLPAGVTDVIEGGQFPSPHFLKPSEKENFFQEFIGAYGQSYYDSVSDPGYYPNSNDLDQLRDDALEIMNMQLAKSVMFGDSTKGTPNSKKMDGYYTVLEREGNVKDAGVYDESTGSLLTLSAPTDLLFEQAIELPYTKARPSTQRRFRAYVGTKMKTSITQNVRGIRNLQDVRKSSHNVLEIETGFGIVEVVVDTNMNSKPNDIFIVDINSLDLMFQETVVRDRATKEIAYGGYVFERPLDFNTTSQDFGLYTKASLKYNSAVDGVIIKNVKIDLK